PPWRRHHPPRGPRSRWSIPDLHEGAPRRPWYGAPVPSRPERGLVGLLGRGLPAWAALAAVSWAPSLRAEPAGATQYRKKVEPILDRFCSSCHAGGSNKRRVLFSRPRFALLPGPPHSLQP